MKAIRIRQTGGPDVIRWEDVEVGEPGEGQARIRHTAVGVNFIDTYHRSGLYPIPLPGGLGSEAAGFVEAVGPGVTVVKPGDRVAYAGGPPGSYSEARLLHPSRLARAGSRTLGSWEAGASDHGRRGRRGVCREVAAMSGEIEHG